MVQLIEGDKEVAVDKDEIEPVVAHDIVGAQEYSVSGWARWIDVE